MSAADGLWTPGAPGVIELPSGRRVRGRALRHDPGDPPATWSLRLSRPRRAPGTADDGSPGPTIRWIDWPDFGLPRDRDDAREAFREAWERAATERVEVACTGGVGRTGTALACIAILDGVDPASAVRFVRASYHRRAVEMPWQKRYVASFGRG